MKICKTCLEVLFRSCDTIIKSHVKSFTKHICVCHILVRIPDNADGVVHVDV